MTDDAASMTQFQSADDRDAAMLPEDEATSHASQKRRVPRFTWLIRAAKLITPQGEFVCVVRDVSEAGVGMRLFHKMPSGSPVDLQMPSGQVYRVEQAWARGNEVGFAFQDTVDVTRLISETSEYPKRGLRLNLVFPIRITTLTQRCEGMVANLSQQGAQFACDAKFAIDQNLRVATAEAIPEFSEVRAKVRWRRENAYGVVFDDTFRLGGFARLAARLQSPGLLND